MKKPVCTAIGYLLLSLVLFFVAGILVAIFGGALTIPILLFAPFLVLFFGAGAYFTLAVWEAIWDIDDDCRYEWVNVVYQIGLWLVTLTIIYFGIVQLFGLTLDNTVAIIIGIIGAIAMAVGMVMFALILYARIVAQIRAREDAERDACSQREVSRRNTF